MPGDIGRAKAAPSVQIGGRYAAFISYSHRDEEFGDWLHKRLESYRVPAAISLNTTTADGHAVTRLLLSRRIA